MDIVLCAAVAAGLYFLVAYLLIDRAGLVPQGLDRIVQVHEFVANDGAHRPGDVYVLGSSVALEGIDCSILERELDGRAAFNLAWSASSVRQTFLLLPRLRENQPGLIVYGVDTFSLFAAGPIPPERVALAAWWEFVPDSERPWLHGILSPAEWAVLTAQPATHLLRFRSFPLGTLDSQLREAARRDQRWDGYATNFKAPWVQRRGISENAMERTMRSIVENLERADSAAFDATLALLEQAFGYLREKGGRAAIVLTPMHPRLAAQLDADMLYHAQRRLREMAARFDGVLIDHSSILPAEDFFDPFHPSHRGRDEWSRRLGEDIAQYLAS